MAAPRDIDTLLKGWEFQPGEVSARLVKARNGREVLQMRVDMGMLQMEADLRPDGGHPHGA
ncbi:MAG: DNA helicase UvrBC, partial [Planctomycetota bacterium]